MPYYSFTATQTRLRNVLHSGYTYAKNREELGVKVYEDGLRRGHPLTVLGCNEVRGKNVPEGLRENPDLVLIIVTY